MLNSDVVENGGAQRSRLPLIERQPAAIWQYRGKLELIDKDGVVRYFQQGFSTNEDFMAEVKKLGL